MRLAPDHHVIVQQDVELLQRGGAGLGDGDVVARRGGVAARVIVDHDDGACPQFEGPLGDLAGIDRSVVDRAGLLALMGD